MSTRDRLVAVLFAVAALGAGCDTEDPTRARVKNAYPPAADGGESAEQVDVYRVATSTQAPERLLALRSKSKLAVERGDTLEIEVSAATFDGDCDAGDSLSQAEADIVTRRIFPANFDALVYDATTCMVSAASASKTDVGADD